MWRKGTGPGDAVLSPQGSLVDLRAGRCGGDATEVDSLHSEGVRGTEDTADIVHRSHIVEHHHQWQLFRLSEFLYREALHLYRAKLLQLQAKFIAKCDGEHFVMDSIITTRKEFRQTYIITRIKRYPIIFV